MFLSRVVGDGERRGRRGNNRLVNCIGDMQKVLILQIENRSDPLLEEFMKRNKRYCEAHGYDYLRMESGRDNVSYYWSKVFELDRLMKERPDVGLFCWLDSDAFVVDLDRDIRSFLESKDGFSMFISPDQPEWDAKFNAGVFIVRNDEMGRSIVGNWKSFYPPKNWKREGKKWVSIGYDPNDKKTHWAGVYYEQGAFIHYVLEDPKFAKYIYSFPYYVLQEFDCKLPHKDQTFSIHLASPVYKQSDGPKKVNLNICKDVIVGKLSTNNLIEHFTGFSEGEEIGRCNIILIVLCAFLMFLVMSKV